MIYAFVYPEKFEGDKGSKLMQLAKMSPDDMKVINNMQLLGGTTEIKKAKSGFSLKFDGQKTKHAARKDRAGEEEETWQLFRFYPVLEEIIENLNKGILPKNEYPSTNQSENVQDGSLGGSVRARRSSDVAPERKAPAHSMRTRRTPNWARPSYSDDGYSSDSVLKNACNDLKRMMGKRIFVFIVGGATRSELRACHKLTGKLKREIILGCTTLDDPPQYLTKLKMLSEKELRAAAEQQRFF